MMFTLRDFRRLRARCTFSFFFFNDTATTEIYPLSLHDALPIFPGRARQRGGEAAPQRRAAQGGRRPRPLRPEDPPVDRARGDRKSTRLNSSHSQISYAVFCLKKKNPDSLTCAASSSHLRIHSRI